MFRFANPEYLYLFFIIPIYVLLLIYTNHKQKKRLKEYGNPEVLSQLMPDVSKKKPVVKSIIQMLALAILIVVVAEPQFGSKLKKVKRQGSEIMIALDVSNSMMAQDITPDRLDKSKLMLSRLIEKLHDDKIGLVVFAGEAFTQIPITSDFVSAKMFLQTISPDLIRKQGTAIGSAVDLCRRSFGPKGKAERAVIVITDGENFEDDAVGSAKAALDEGIKVSVIGMGSLKGAPIPVKNGNEYHKDKDGNVVVTKLNEEMCRKIAASGGGIYVRADNTNAASRVIAKEIDKMDKADVESNVYSEYDEQFQAFAWIVLILLVLDIFIFERKSDYFRKIKLF